MEQIKLKYGLYRERTETMAYMQHAVVTELECRSNSNRNTKSELELLIIAVVFTVYDITLIYV